MTLMAASMAAMMLPTAVPFFVALRKPGRIAVVAAIYTAVWAGIGVAAALLMTQVMLPSTAWVAVIAVAFAAAYALTPWQRRAARRCREMCLDARLVPAWRAGVVYSANCIVCSAGVMVAAIVVGMSSVLLMAVAAAVVLAYKIAPRRVLAVI